MRDVFDKGDKDRYSKQVYEVECVGGNVICEEGKRRGYRTYHIKLMEQIDDPVLNRTVWDETSFSGH